MRKFRSITEELSGDGIKHVVAELDIDSVSDLPQQQFGEFFLEMGTLAHDISTGAFYALDSTGTWYAQDGSGAVEVSENAESV